MNRNARQSGRLLTATVAAAFSLFSLALPAQATGTEEAARLWISGGGAQTFEQMVLNSVDTADSAAIDSALETIDALEETAAKGENPQLLGKRRSVGQAKSELKDAREARQKTVGKPCAGKPHARIERGMGKQGHLGGSCAPDYQ